MTTQTLAAEAWHLAFGDLPMEDGLRLREGAAWRHFPAPDTARYRRLLSIADLDAFLRTDAARGPRVSMADGGRKGTAAVPEDEYLLGDSPRVDLPRLLARLDAGATLVVSQFHEIHPPLARLCRGLEKAFLHGVQANVYLTPPGAQGFRVHFDTHDVLVLQVSGEKRWRIWDATPLLRPTRRTPWENRYKAEGEPHALTLRPGDALYIPRGVLHDAAAQEGEEPSLHLTIGFLEPCWAEMLRTALDLLEAEDPALREAFPTWRLPEPDGVASLATRAAPLLAALARPEVTERMAMAALDRLAQDRLPLPGRGLFPAPVRPDGRLRLSDAMHHHLVPLPDGGAALHWHGGAERLSAEQFAWLERLEDGASPAELGEGALDFCRRLAGSGLLEPED